MTSPNIKFQSIIRNYKNGLHEELDKKKIIFDYTYNLSLNEVPLAKALFFSKFSELYVYDWADLMHNDPPHPESASIDIPANRNTKPYLAGSPGRFGVSPGHLASPGHPASPGRLGASPVIKNASINEYMGDGGYFENVYRAELCNTQWLICMHFINRLYVNFMGKDRALHINSLHISHSGDREEYGDISAMHHFVHNSHVTENILNVEWKWLNISGLIKSDPAAPDELKSDPIKPDQATQLYNKYGENMLPDLPDIRSTIDKIHDLGKLNFLYVRFSDSDPSAGTGAGTGAGSGLGADYATYIKYAILVLKTFGINCMACIPIGSNWHQDIKTANILLLYALIFREIYVYNFDVENRRIVYLVCKDKKRFSVEPIYKKLMSVLSDASFSAGHNLFSAEYMSQNYAWLQSIDDIRTGKRTKVSPITFSDIAPEVSHVLKLNTQTFLD
jgi:hypothetical protein